MGHRLGRRGGLLPRRVPLRGGGAEEGSRLGRGCVNFVAPLAPSRILPTTNRRTSMANWRQLAMSALLADGAIDEREVEILRKEFFADRRIDRAEMEFLLEARKKAASCV